jgi:flagellum-specific ATP synthase
MQVLRQLGDRAARVATRGAMIQISGTIIEVTPTSYRVNGLSRFVKLGDCVTLQRDAGRRHGEIVRVDRSGATIKPYDSTADAALGAPVYLADPVAFAPDPSWKGRVINALGEPVDGRGPLMMGPDLYSADAEPPPALSRARVKKPLKSGVRVIDIFTPICAGQRIGIFAGSGVGKSTLLGMLAGAKGFDTVVIGLVGERGREVREFIEESLGANRPKAVTVVATGDESSMMRQMAPRTATTIAEYFRDRGDSVLLMIDSVTRFAHAARDVALAAGEPAVARGYAPSVSRVFPSCWSARAQARKARARSPESFPCWSMATITTIRSPIASVARSMGTLCWTVRSAMPAAIPRSTSWRRSRGSPIKSGHPRNATWSIAYAR